GGGDRAVHGSYRPQPLRSLCLRLRRTNWLSLSGSPSGAGHRCDLAKRQRLSAGFERRLESYPDLLEGTVTGKSRRTARLPQARTAEVQNQARVTKSVRVATDSLSPRSRPLSPPRQ